MITKRTMLNTLNKKVDRLALNMEKMKLADYVYYLEHPRKLLISNFLGGVSRGFGIAIGFTLLGAMFIYILRMVAMRNLPVIGDFISEIVKIVQDNMSKTGGRIGG